MSEVLRFCRPGSVAAFPQWPLTSCAYHPPSSVVPTARQSPDAGQDTEVTSPPNWPTLAAPGIGAAFPQAPFFSVTAKALPLPPLVSPLPTAVHSAPGAHEMAATSAPSTGDVPGTLLAVPHVPVGLLAEAAGAAVPARARLPPTPTRRAPDTRPAQKTARRTRLIRFPALTIYRNFPDESSHE